MLTVGQDGYYLEDRDYNIVREAGAGGSASCYPGNDKVKPAQQFVIKKQKKSLGEEEKQNMMRESRILKDIDHVRSVSDPFNVLNASGEKFNIWWSISIYILLH